MRMKSPVFLAALLLTGPLTGRASAQLVEKRVVLAQFGACLAKSAPQMSMRLLMTEPGSKQEHETAGSLALGRDACLHDRAVLTMQSAAIRGAVAEAILRGDVGLLDRVSELPNAPADRVSVGLQIEPFMVAFGRCIARAAPAKSAAIIRTLQSSAGEKSAVLALGTVLSDCVATDVAYHLNIGDLRMHLAPALYLLAQTGATGSR